MRRDEVLRILGEHREELVRLGVRSLALFGSAARDEASDASDIDLLVEFTGRVGLFHFLEVKEFLEAVLGRSVDLGTPDSLHPRLRERVLREAVRVA